MPYDPDNLPYCGAPPVPADLWRQWNLDPVLIAVLMAVAVIYYKGWRRREAHGRSEIGRNEAVCFFSGWLIATLALISPLCPLSVALFAARVGQHMILALVAAPLIMLGRPEVAFAAFWRPLPVGSRAGTIVRACTGRVGAWLAFATFIWFWHAPGPYAATFASDSVYWAMHITLFGSALLLWRTLVGGDARQHAAAVLSGFTTSLHMGLLGAIITLAPRAVYEPHAATTGAWDLSPLADQQLGGLLMWVPGGGLFLIAGMLSTIALLRSLAEQPATSR